MTDVEDMTESLTQAIKSCKRLTLSQFVKQMMSVLKQNSWDIEHLIDALADYADQRDDWEAAVKHLEDASIEISRLRRLLLITIVFPFKLPFIMFFERLSKNSSCQITNRPFFALSPRF